MTQSAEMYELRLERSIRAPIERVFRALTDDEDLRRWSAPEGLVIEAGEADARVGGKWRVVMVNPQNGERYIATGEYREVTPPRRLVYTHWWETDANPVETLITVTLAERDGKTQLVMVHEGFLHRGARDGHEQGWSSCFNRLQELLES